MAPLLALSLLTVVLHTILPSFSVLGGLNRQLLLETTLARMNCQGYSQELLNKSAPSLTALLQTTQGRQDVRAAALNQMHCALLTLGEDGAVLRDDRALPICGVSWLDWLPWIPCRVQSPPPRPEFLDEGRDDAETEEPLCWTPSETTHTDY